MTIAFWLFIAIGVILVAIIVWVAYATYKKENKKNGDETLPKTPDRESDRKQKQENGDERRARIGLGFAWFGGAEKKVLRDQPSGVIANRAGFGALMAVAVIASALMASVAAVYLLKATWAAAVAVAMIWFMAIWQLDRTLIMQVDRDEKSAWWKFAVRLVMVLCISYINSSVIEMIIFKPEIDATLQAMQRVRTTAVSDSIAAQQAPILDEIQAIDKSIANEERELREQWAAYTGEIAGNVGSGIPGVGPAARAQREAIVADSIRVAAFTTRMREQQAVLRQQLAALETAESEAIQEIRQESAGIEARHHVLWHMRWSSALGIGIFLMLFIFEALPVLMKMMSPEDEYSRALRRQVQSHARVHELEDQRQQRAAESESAELLADQARIAENRLGSETRLATARAEMAQVPLVAAAEALDRQAERRMESTYSRFSKLRDLARRAGATDEELRRISQQATRELESIKAELNLN